MKKQPQRTCIGCNTKKDKKELVRVVKNKEGKIFLDRTGKQDGRGAYICDSIECLEKARKAKRIERAFEMTISDDIYEEIRGVMIDRAK